MDYILQMQQTLTAYCELMDKLIRFSDKLEIDYLNFPPLLNDKFCASQADKKCTLFIITLGVHDLGTPSPSTRNIDVLKYLHNRTLFCLYFLI